MGEFAETLEKYEIKINKTVDRNEFKEQLSFCNYLDEQVEECVLYGGKRVDELFKDTHINFATVERPSPPFVDCPPRSNKAYFIKNHYFERGEIRSNYVLLLKCAEGCVKYIYDDSNKGNN